MHKGAFLADLPASENAIWGVSETHLIQLGVQKFRGELRFNKSQYAFYPGAPAPTVPMLSVPSAESSYS